MRKVLYRILLVINVLFAFSLLLSYLAVHISPEKFVLPAFFGLAYPYLLFINIVLSIVWITMLRYEALLSIIVISFGLTHFSNYIKLHKSEGNTKDTFKVLSYNLKLFNYFEKAGGVTSEKKVLEFLKTQQADIICLQEFFVQGNSSQKDAEIKRELGGKYYSHMKVLGSGKNKAYGIVTYSKYPIIKRGEIIHPKSSSLSIYSDVVIRNDTFRIYNNHLQSFRLKRMERSFVEEIVNPEDKETINGIKSLSVSLKEGFVMRAIQSHLVKEHINGSPYPVIVTGDFNDTPVSFTYRKIRKGLNDSFVSSGYGAGFTYKGNYPPNRIDYILYDNALINSSFEIIKVKYSDHYPIIASFSLTPKTEVF